MSVQFNLLPDVKVQYLKIKRQEHLVIFISTIASIAIIVVLVVLLSIVYGVQKKTLGDLNSSITSSSSQLKNTQGLSQVLTVQNQLNTIPTLDSQKVVSSRLFNYLTQITPTTATISQLSTDFTQNTLTISGNANTLATVNQFVDTLKFTNYTVSGQSGQKSAFSDVVLASFNTNGQSTSYAISANFDPTLFSASENVSLTIPNLITTRSVLDQPSALFQGNTGGQ